MPSSDTARRIDALLGVCLRLARTAPSGRMVLARLAHTLEPEWISNGDLAAELDKARESALDPLSARAVERALRDAWGVKPAEELDELDPEPVAVTPTAQVHRGVLEGEPVAIKLLQRGLAATVRQDLVLLDTLATPLNAAFPKLDAPGLIAEIRERVADELDLEHEAQMQRRFHRALRSHPFLSVPEPVTRLAHPGVLVSAWAEGVSLASAPDPDLAAARLLAFVIGAARFGVMHADPDLDDVLIQPDGGLVILDFGATRTVVPTRVDSTHAALEAFAAGDAAALGAALASLNVLPAEEAAIALELGRHALGGKGQASTRPEAPTRLDSSALAAVRSRLRERPEDLQRLALAAALPPEDLWPARAVVQLFAVIAGMGASGDWLELARAALRDGWDGPSVGPATGPAARPATLT